MTEPTPNAELAHRSTPDPRHWSTTDGHRYTSIPTTIPVSWKQKHTDSGLTYVSGDYSIVRTVGPNGSRTYTVHRDGIELPLSFTSLLWHAKARAERNAAGQDVVNVA